MIKAIIFDFDGVITESVGVKADGFAMLYEPHGKEIMDKVIEHHYANGGVSRYEKFRFYHKEFLGYNLSDDELKKLCKKLSKFVVKRIIEAPYVKGAINFSIDSLLITSGIHNSFFDQLNPKWDNTNQFLSKFNIKPTYLCSKFQF